ncbi:hypothetical protein AVEN_241131-1 [Araneus ventricosus]|uniref:DUF4371 domain-containing protein n=1 Tax=Araneus ventricosus TaxID=182803 RepID=A0A4Y2JAW6_ARAVE|nr:hypothetical protein AVEN_241131-1 [Araneus ventricosus]
MMHFSDHLATTLRETRGEDIANAVQKCLEDSGIDINKIVSIATDGARNSPLCVCGQVGDADHYTFSCSLTQKFHLVKPADAHKRAWFQNLINNSQALNKLKEAFRISGDVCDSLTQAV